MKPAFSLPLPVVNGRSANIGPKLWLRRTGTRRLESKVQVKPPAEEPIGKVVVSPRISPSSAAAAGNGQRAGRGGLRAEQDVAQRVPGARGLDGGGGLGASLSGGKCDDDERHYETREHGAPWC